MFPQQPKPNHAVKNVWSHSRVLGELCVRNLKKKWNTKNEWELPPRWCRFAAQHEGTVRGSPALGRRWCGCGTSPPDTRKCRCLVQSSAVGWWVEIAPGEEYHLEGPNCMEPVQRTASEQTRTPPLQLRGKGVREGKYQKWATNRRK